MESLGPESKYRKRDTTVMGYVHRELKTPLTEGIRFTVTAGKLEDGPEGVRIKKALAMKNVFIPDPLPLTIAFGGFTTIAGGESIALLSDHEQIRSLINIVVRMERRELEKMEIDEAPSHKRTRKADRIRLIKSMCLGIIEGNSPDDYTERTVNENGNPLPSHAVVISVEDFPEVSRMSGIISFRKGLNVKSENVFCYDAIPLGTVPLIAAPESAGENCFTIGETVMVQFTTT